MCVRVPMHAHISTNEIVHAIFVKKKKNENLFVDLMSQYTK